MPRAGLALLLATAALAAAFSAFSVVAFRAANSRSILLFFSGGASWNATPSSCSSGLAWPTTTRVNPRSGISSESLDMSARGLSGGCLGVLSADRQGESCRQPVCLAAVWRTERSAKTP